MSHPQRSEVRSMQAEYGEPKKSQWSVPLHISRIPSVMQARGAGERTTSILVTPNFLLNSTPGEYPFQPSEHTQNGVGILH